MSDYYALILAGGSGTRLWPLSRRKSPKQLLALVGDRTMYRITIERLHPLIPAEKVYVVTNAEMAGMLQEQEPLIDPAHYIIEPSPKDSGPAAALGLAHIHHHDPQATVAILSADHFIGKIDAYQRALRVAHEVAQKGYIVTLGITPSRPSTGFGYIERGDELGEYEGLKVYHTVRFTEKPSREIAERWISDNRHSWNSGMFVLTTGSALHEFTRQQPVFQAALDSTERSIGTADYEHSLNHTWETAPGKSIDFAIMEGARHMAVIPVDIEWSDIGTWASLLDVLSSDEHGNVIIGDHVGVDTRNTLVRGGPRLIATIGLNNLVVVDTADVLLICPIDRVQEVKQLVELLRASKRHDVL